MLTGTNLKYAKAHNVRTVLQTIRLYGPLARKEIAQRTELTLQTVSNLTRKLIEAELIREGDRLKEGRGAPTSMLSLNPEGAYSIGLDLDKDHLTGVLVDFSGTVCHRVTKNLDFPSPDEAMDLMTDFVGQLMEKMPGPREKVWGIGVGLPGPLNVSNKKLVTNVVNPNSFPGWTNVPVRDTLTQRLGLPVFLENNASAAAVGERWYGEGRHIKSFYYLFFGSGLGGGLVINGQPFEGHTGNSGEIGLIPTATGRGELTGIDKPHLGFFFNMPRLFHLLQQQGIQVSRPPELRKLFAEKEETLIQWLEEGITQLAPYILAIGYLIDPEAIFLGGCYPQEMFDYIQQRLEETLAELRVENNQVLPRLLCAQAGVDAAAMGVATLPIYSILSPTPDMLMKHTSGEKIATLDF